MNQHFKPAATTVRLPADQTPGYAAKMLELFLKLDELRRTFCPMEDDTMDSITEATYAVGRSIIDAPAIDQWTIAIKFRYAAIMIEDPDGVMDDEPRALAVAFKDLVALRDADWQAQFGKPCPWYGERENEVHRPDMQICPSWQGAGMYRYDMASSGEFFLTYWSEEFGWFELVEPNTGRRAYAMCQEVWERNVDCRMSGAVTA